MGHLGKPTPRIRNTKLHSSVTSKTVTINNMNNHNPLANFSTKGLIIELLDRLFGKIKQAIGT